MTCVEVTVLCNQPKAFTLDLGDDHSRYLFHTGTSFFPFQALIGLVGNYSVIWDVEQLNYRRKWYSQLCLHCVNIQNTLLYYSEIQFWICVHKSQCCIHQVHLFIAVMLIWCICRRIAKEFCVKPCMLRKMSSRGIILQICHLMTHNIHITVIAWKSGACLCDLV